MCRIIPVLLAWATLLHVSSADPDRHGPDMFLVRSPGGGLALLGADGEEREAWRGACGAFSPDGQWLTYVESDKALSPGRLVLRSRRRPEERLTIPAFGGTSGSGCQFVWTPDSKRVLIVESRPGENGTQAKASRLYELATKKLVELKIPNWEWISGWSGDGKRLLAQTRPDAETVRIAWLNADGTGEPEFITSENEIAYHGALSPDGSRVLCLAGPKAPKGERSRVRLCVIDLSTNKRTIVDEPGETYGHCWSRDGSRIAYTWQRSLEKPEDVSERETFLITCLADGRNRKVVTRRTYEVPPNSSGRSGVVYFFNVLGWR